MCVVREGTDVVKTVGLYRDGNDDLESRFSIPIKARGDVCHVPNLTASDSVRCHCFCPSPNLAPSRAYQLLVVFDNTSQSTMYMRLDASSAL